MLGDSSRQVVIGDFARDAQYREGMYVTTDEGFEALAMGELQISEARSGYLWSAIFGFSRVLSTKCSVGSGYPVICHDAINLERTV